MEANFIPGEGFILKKIMKKRIENFPVEKFPSPSETLKNIHWPHPPAKVSLKQFIAWDINLDPFSVLGRTATALAVIEKLFPQCQIKTAEIIKDMVAEFMLEIPFKDRDDTYMEKILDHESTHLIIKIDEQQYDLKSNSPCKHPKIIEFDAWEGVAVWRMISNLTQYDDSLQKINLLLDIKKTHPSSLINYHLISLYLEVNEMEKSIQAAQELFKERPQAVICYLLYLLTGEKKYKEDLSAIYGPNMFKFITKRRLK